MSVASLRNSRGKCPVRVWGLESIKVDNEGKKRKATYKGEWTVMRLQVVESGGREGGCYTVYSIVSICNS